MTQGTELRLRRANLVIVPKPGLVHVRHKLLMVTATVLADRCLALAKYGSGVTTSAAEQMNGRQRELPCLRRARRALRAGTLLY
jgi:hypothetical protein